MKNKEVTLFLLTDAKASQIICFFPFRNPDFFLFSETSLIFPKQASHWSGRHKPCIWGKREETSISQIFECGLVFTHVAPTYWWL